MRDSMPPITLDEMIKILQNPNFKTYLVLGEEASEAWKLALAAQRYLPGLRTYLVEPKSQDEVRAHFEVPSEHIGVIFGRCDSVKKTLTENEAGDFVTIAESIDNA